jgi:RNA polymerase sigma-70 factor (sigma-E family)
MDTSGLCGFATFAAANGPSLVRLATLLAPDSDGADDVVQDVLVRMFVRWDRLEDGEPVAYARRAVVNECTSLGRRRTRWRRLLEAQRGDLRTANADFTSVLADADALWQAVCALPARQRAAIVLRYYEGLDNDAIAEALGCGESTVRSQIHRALTTLEKRVTVLNGAVT